LNCPHLKGEAITFKTNLNKTILTKWQAVVRVARVCGHVAFATNSGKLLLDKIICSHFVIGISPNYELIKMAQTFDKNSERKTVGYGAVL
jgi:hypothetical protein